MPPEPPQLPEEASLIIQRGAGMVTLPQGGSPALSEIISRSLAHLRTCAAVGKRHRIGEHELCAPDYQLVCTWAEELQLTPEDVLKRLLKRRDMREKNLTTIVDGRFTSLVVDGEALPVSSLPPIEDLAIEILIIWRDPSIKLDLSPLQYLKSLACLFSQLTELDLSIVPNLVMLFCFSNQLTELELSESTKLLFLDCSFNRIAELNLSDVSNLSLLTCASNLLTEVDLSGVPNLTQLDCSKNQLTQLDLSRVPNLTMLKCSENQLTELDLSGVPNLKSLWCSENQLTELDTRNLMDLETLKCDATVRVIHRPDQNF